MRISGNRDEVVDARGAQRYRVDWYVIGKILSRDDNPDVCGLDAHWGARNHAPVGETNGELGCHDVLHAQHSPRPDDHPGPLDMICEIEDHRHCGLAYEILTSDRNSKDQYQSYACQTQIL